MLTCSAVLIFPRVSVGMIYMDRKLTPQDLVDAVNGDLEAFALVLKQPHTIIQECRQALSELVLLPEVVRNVLIQLQRHVASPPEVQQWASFVMHGYVAGSKGGPILPIDIDYAPSTEEQIADVILRLDEIGDLIDGEISDDELASMIQKLSLSE